VIQELLLRLEIICLLKEPRLRLVLRIRWLHCIDFRYGQLILERALRSLHLDGGPFYFPHLFVLHAN
jgi:hypothetical protein